MFYKSHGFFSSPKGRDLLWDPPSLTLDACSNFCGAEMAWTWRWQFPSIWSRC